ncbi:hypothetical protein BHM03_00005528 [Ensete ventricosum]|nr:hypothetical protein BHM03_00005528 [Ensete ventricosum]
MSQDRLSSLFPNRVAEEAISSTPAAVTIPQVTVAVGPPSETNGCGTIHADSRQILEAAHRSWAHPPSPHLVPNGYDRGFLRSSPSSTSLNRDDTGCHPPHSPVSPNGGSMLGSLETRSEASSIVPEKPTTLYLGVEHTTQEPYMLSSDSTDSLRVQLWRVNKRLDEIHMEVTKSKEEAGESSSEAHPSLSRYKTSRYQPV